MLRPLSRSATGRAIPANQERFPVWDRPRTGLQGCAGLLWLTTSPAGANWGRLWRIDLAGSGSATAYATTAGGRGLGIDPLTGELFVAERGRPSEGGGEVLRVDTSVFPARAGHWRGAEFELFDIAEPALGLLAEAGGSLALSSAGDFYLATSGGRVLRADRASGTTALVLGNTDRAVDLALAPGTPGTAGTGGASLFVLGEAVLFELGVDDLPAPPPPASPPGLAPPADLTVVGQAVAGQLTPVAIDSPADANRFAVVVVSFAGKVPGLPLSVLGNPADPRGRSDCTQPANGASWDLAVHWPLACLSCARNGT